MAIRPESYPFLSIASDFHLDYGAVLRAAHFMRHGGDLTIETEKLLDDGYVRARMEWALDEQLAVANGEIDWETGEQR